MQYNVRRGGETDSIIRNMALGNKGRTLYPAPSVMRHITTSKHVCVVGVFSVIVSVCKDTDRKPQPL